MSNIESKLKALKRIAIGAVDPFAFGNPRKMTDRMTETLKQSLTEMGVVEPIVVRPSPRTKGRYEILNGHHRYGVLKDSGATEIEAVVVDLPDDRKARALVLALNQIGAEWDYSALSNYVSAWLNDNTAGGEWFKGVTGFSGDEIEVLSAGTIDATNQQLSEAPEKDPSDLVAKMAEEAVAANQPKVLKAQFATREEADAVLGKFRLGTRFGTLRADAIDGGALAKFLEGQ